MEQRSVYSASDTRSVVEINKVLKNTYLLLSMTLAFSAVCAWITMQMDLSFVARIGLMIAAIASLFAISKFQNSTIGLGLVFLFTGLMGAGLGPLLNYYLNVGYPGLIMEALGTTAIIFVALSGYAIFTKKDFSFMGGFLVVGLVFAIIASIANIFFAIPALYLAINAVIVFIFSGFILYDTSRIVKGGETNYVMATVSLYLNIYNLFTSLLALLNAFGGDD
ncbi:Bax inhibitor-1/YccA family protein [Glaciecola sp. MF2-115]|uniref:Bax inhibitor-1/YccA family protein n=1 Tax=Glaciecola sp. MF2-115 TaxID=3384827 RepID=UPI0039A19F07|mmetsp:Transcript_63549/g.200971  ORF Transcript_63549/g.200971 Transcript_63549/m.200971 type:complete len:222 (-) Transcript_63549:116-781(-)